MERNGCDGNNIDTDAHLPPRKRLLAGMKRQNCDGYCHTQQGNCDAVFEFDARISTLLRPYLHNANPSDEDIIEASRMAVTEAVRVADRARAVAEEKAAKAAKASAAAKSALELVAILSEETPNRGRHSKKNRMKKQVQVETLYGNKEKGSMDCRTDEEIARELHQAMNSSPRITKNASSSDPKNQKQKKLRTSNLGKDTVENGGLVIEGHNPSYSNADGVVVEVENEGPLEEANMVMVDLNALKVKNGQELLGLENGERSRSSNADAQTLQSKEKYAESSDSFGKKKGKIKQKKLPLSICSVKDQRALKDELKHKNMSQNTVEDGVSKSMVVVGSPSGSLVPLEKPSMWKCQSFKAPASVKQVNSMQL